MPTVRSVAWLSEDSYSSRFAVACVLFFSVVRKRQSPSVPLAYLFKEGLIQSVVIYQTQEGTSVVETALSYINLPYSLARTTETTMSTQVAKLK